MRCRRLTGPGIGVVAVWLWIASLAPAANALVTCTGTQSLADSGTGDSCSTAADSGSVTEAQASVNSIATASAKGTSVAGAQASELGIAHAKARTTATRRRVLP